MNELSKEHLAEYREAFKLCVKSGQETITSQDLGNLLRSLGQTPTESDLQDFMCNVGAGDEITFEDFCNLMSKVTKFNDLEDEVREAFKFFDKDGDGFISQAEFRTVMHNIGEKLTDEEIEMIIADADEDGDGLINYEEFVKMIN